GGAGPAERRRPARLSVDGGRLAGDAGRLPPARPPGRFEWPLALVGLMVVPAVVAAYLYRERRRVDAVRRFGNPALLPNIVDAAPGWRRHLPLAVLLVALAAMVVGVARPHATVSVKQQE